MGGSGARPCGSNRPASGLSECTARHRVAFPGSCAEASSSRLLTSAASAHVWVSALNWCMICVCSIVSVAMIPYWVTCEPVHDMQRQQTMGKVHPGDLLSVQGRMIEGLPVQAPGGTPRHGCRWRCTHTGSAAGWQL